MVALDSHLLSVVETVVLDNLRHLAAEMAGLANLRILVAVVDLAKRLLWVKNRVHLGNLQAEHQVRQDLVKPHLSVKSRHLLDNQLAILEDSDSLLRSMPNLPGGNLQLRQVDLKQAHLLKQHNPRNLKLRHSHRHLNKVEDLASRQLWVSNRTVPLGSLLV